MDLERYDLVEGTFEPVKRDDLRPLVAKWIGRRLSWRAGWFITEDDGGEYVGQWAMLPMGGEHAPDFQGGTPFAWVPLCDLADVKLTQRLEGGDGG